MSVSFQAARSLATDTVAALRQFDGAVHTLETAPRAAADADWTAKSARVAISSAGIDQIPTADHIAQLTAAANAAQGAADAARATLAAAPSEARAAADTLAAQLRTLQDVRVRTFDAGPPWLDDSLAVLDTVNVRSLIGKLDLAQSTDDYAAIGRGLSDTGVRSIARRLDEMTTPRVATGWQGVEDTRPTPNVLGNIMNERPLNIP